jgi:hypothetical protein
LPYRREAEAARAWGVPRSILLGRPMPGPGEPLWLPEDRWWALALLEVEAAACRDCGHPTGETTAAEAEYRYDAQVVRCHACAAGARRMAAVQEDGTRPEGLQVSIYRKEGSG